MTGRLRYTPGENEPSINLRVNGDDRVEMTRQNTTLYMFLGNLGMFNHVYFAEPHDAEEPQSESFYVFSHVQGFDVLQDNLMKLGYPMIVNQTEINSSDIEAYERSLSRLIADIDHVPDDWV